jgi:hypothetical protein
VEVATGWLVAMEERDQASALHYCRLLTVAHELHRAVVGSG